MSASEQATQFRPWRATGATVRFVAYTCELDGADMFPLSVWPVDDTDREPDAELDGFMVTGSPESPEWRGIADDELSIHGYRRVEDWYYEGRGVFSACGTRIAQTEEK